MHVNILSHACARVCTQYSYMYSASLVSHVMYTTQMQISYTQDVLTGGSAPSMSGHFQLYPSERNLILALLAMVKKFGWNQLSLLTQNEKPYIKVQ